MERTLWSARSWSFALGAGFLVGVAGCESGGPSQNAADSGSNNGAATATASAPAQTTGVPNGEAQRTTPTPRLDPKQLVDVVKEEVQGGEAAAGPTPFEYLWMPSDPKLVHDEPLTVKVPAGLEPLINKANVPAANPITKGKYELGRQLFFDPRVSLDGSVSCATCHNPDKGWTDQMPVSTGIAGQTGGRSAPSVLNTVYGKTMFWDGRAPSLEGQSQGPVQNPIEMGKQSYKDIITRLRTIPGYVDQFKKVFGTNVTLDGMAKSIATFERVAALSGGSAFDKYKAGDMKALSESQKRGMVLFGLPIAPDDDFKTTAVLQKAKCTLCHAGFNFTDEQFHNLGIGWDGSKNPGKFADLGRWAVEAYGARNDASVGAFKTPTVRDAEHTAPYMHDGSLATLEDVVEHYDKGGIANPQLDPDMKKLGLTAQEKADLVAFMKGLSGETRKLAELLPTLPPGPDGKTIDPRPALTPPVRKKIAAVMFHPRPAN